MKHRPKKLPSGRDTAWLPSANPELAQGMRDLASSGASGTHGDRRTKRLRDRTARRRAAIRDQDQGE